MATDSPFGFRAVSGHTDGNCYLEAFIPAADGTATFIGDAVKLYGTHTSGELGPAVVQAAAGDPIFGFVERFLPDYDQLVGDGWNYRKASTLRRCLIVKALPTITFECQANSALTTAMFGSHFDIAVGAGDTVTGRSGMEIDTAGGGSGTSAQLTLISPANAVNEDFDTTTVGLNVLVQVLESVYTGTASGLAG